VGIALAERECTRNRPVVAIIGDGSFQYSVQSICDAISRAAAKALNRDVPTVLEVPISREVPPLI
jgi:thiamine pyrophosphate-dependent acetolactate synthase large subunit-like protein